MIRCVGNKLLMVMANAVIWERQVLYIFGTRAKHVFHRCSFLYYKSANNFKLGRCIGSNFILSLRFVFTAVSSVGSPFRTGLILGHLESLVMLSPFGRSVYNFKYNNFEKRCLLGCLTNINLVFLA